MITLVWGAILILAIMFILLLYAIPTKSMGVIDAEKARLIKKEVQDRKKVHKLLKPVLKKVVEAADNGLSETRLSERVWDIKDKVIYQQTLSELERLGYKVVKGYSYESGGHFIDISW